MYLIQSTIRASELQFWSRGANKKNIHITVMKNDVVNDGCSDVVNTDSAARCYVFGNNSYSYEL